MADPGKSTRATHRRRGGKVSRLVRWLAVALGIAAVALGIAGSLAERFLNRVRPASLPAVGRRARALHESAFVADLHADSLLSGRDLLERSRVGHVDLPRLREGGVALQVFGIVTRAPVGMNIDRTDGDRFDWLTWLWLARLSPLAFQSPLERALAQAARLQALVHRSEGGLVLVRTRADLDALTAARRAGDARVGALLGIEGAHALEGDPDNLEPLFEAGVRMVGLAHFFDNRFAGSAHGIEKGGLTEAGRTLVRRMEARGVLVDLAHASPKTIEDVLAMATRPVLVSHTGVRGTCDNNRNLSDDQLRAIAAAGGVVGIGYWETAVCGTAPYHVVRAMRHAIAVMGDEHVALGSDYDGAVTVGFDTSALPALTQAMLDGGIAPSSIQKILGGNALRLLRQALPGDRVP